VRHVAKIAKYNAAFFGCVETAFKIMKEKHGRRAALGFLTELMKRNLSKAYAAMGARRHGGPAEYKRVVGARDAAVGLKVSFKDIPTGFVYRFHTDPFPNLRGVVKPEELDATYMVFKRGYLLGPKWNYRTTKHIWRGDKFTEHVFEKSG